MCDVYITLTNVIRTEHIWQQKDDHHSMATHLPKLNHQVITKMWHHKQYKMATEINLTNTIRKKCRCWLSHLNSTEKVWSGKKKIFTWCQGHGHHILSAHSRTTGCGNSHTCTWAPGGCDNSHTCTWALGGSGNSQTSVDAGRMSMFAASWRFCV